jgi:hypothetical protein
MCKDGFKAQIIWNVLNRNGVKIGTVTGNDETKLKKEASVILKVPEDYITLVDSGARKERCGGCGNKAT